MHRASLSDIVAHLAVDMDLNFNEASDLCHRALSRGPSPRSRRTLERLRVRRARRRERLRAGLARQPEI